MLSSIASFLGGTAFRWLVGELLGWIKARDERAAELAMLRLQHDLDRERHQWQQDAIAAQAAAGVRVIEAQSRATRDAAADIAFGAAVYGVTTAQQRSDWIGAWNAAIRPALASMAILLIAAQAVAPSAVVLSPLVMDLICAVLGVFVGERIRTRGQ